LSARAFRAPGRVNLIGEHTDYNLGFVLPVALDLATVATANPAQDGRLHFYSTHFNQERDWDPAELPHVSPAHDWGDYAAGVARELIRAGYPVEPLEIRIESALPEGAGLSSSAALEVSCAGARSTRSCWRKSARPPSAISSVCRAASWTSMRPFSGRRARRSRSTAAA
jgi:galactokinase